MAKLQSDNFDDNIIDISFWEKFYYPSNAADIIEQGQRLEMNCDTTNDILGLNTIKKYDLTRCSLKISFPQPVTIHAQGIWILGEIWRDSQGNRDPANFPALFGMGYYIYKTAAYSEVRIRKNNDLADWTQILAQAWQSSAGSLKIEIQNGIITFREDDIQIYSETWDSAIATTLHILIASVGMTPDLGMGYLDDFVAFEIPLAYEADLVKLKELLQITDTDDDTELITCQSSAYAEINNLLTARGYSTPVSSVDQNIKDAENYFGAAYFRERRDGLPGETFYNRALKFLESWIKAQSDDVIPFIVGESTT